MDCVPESFDGVVGDGSHCGLERRGRGLTKAEEDLASSGLVHGSVYCSLARGEGPAVGGDASSVTLARLVRRSHSLVINKSLAPKMRMQNSSESSPSEL